jgi:hypothetical protein
LKNQSIFFCHLHVLEEKVVSATKATLFSQVCLRKTCTTEARRRTYSLSFSFFFFPFIFYLFIFLFWRETNLRKTCTTEAGKDVQSFFLFPLFIYLFIVLEGNKFSLGSCKIVANFRSLDQMEGQD